MKNLISAIVSICLLTIFSCGSDDESPKSKPKVSFINNVTGLPIPAFATAQIKDSLTFRQRVSIGNASPPVEIPIGNHSITFTDETKKVLQSVSYNFNGDKNISVILANSAALPEFFAVESPAKKSTDTTGTLRFINLIPGVSLNFKVNTTTLNPINFKGSTQTIDLDPTLAHKIEVTASVLPLPLTINNYRIAKGKSVMCFLTLSGTTPNTNFVIY